MVKTVITVEEKSKINKKVLGIIGLIVLGVLALAVGFVSGLKEDSEKEKKESYDKCIKLSDKAYTGAIFTMDFSEVKKVIGRNLSVGDLNSSTGGWQLIYSGSDMKEYGIGSSSGIWEINIITDLDDNVIGVACKTVGLNNGKPNDAEIDSYADVFSEILGKTHDSIKSILIDLSKSGNSYYYQDGIILRYAINNGFCEFIIMAATEEYVEGNGTNNGNGETDITSSVKIPAITDSEDNETIANQETEKPQEETTTNQEIEKPQEETTKEEPSVEEHTTSKGDTLEEIETESQTSAKTIKLSEFKEYDKLLQDGSNVKYIVEFDNEVFDMWIDSYTTELTEYLPDCMWNEDNVVIKQDFSMNSNIGIHIFAFDEIYESDKLMNAGAKKIFIEFRCASSSAYRYDVENTKELYDFILTLAQRMKEKYPVNN